MHVRSVFACCAMACLVLPHPSAALQVQFLVTDKLGRPVPGADICLQEDTTQCQRTDAQGAGTVSPTVGARRPVVAQGLRFTSRPGYLLVETPRSGSARLARYDASGRGLEPARDLDLHAGANRIEWPRGKSGLIFSRIEFAGTRYAFVGLAVVSPAGAPLSALGKAATANLHAFTITKAGYQPYVFRPRSDADSAVVRLTASADTGLRYMGVIRGKIDSIDTAKHAVYYAYPQYACAHDTVLSNTSKAVLPIWIRGGKWYFPAGNCYGVALGKSGDGLYGTWKTLGMEPLPEGLLPVACDPVKDSVVTSVPNLFFLNEGGGWEIDLSADSLVIRLVRRLCPGNQLVSNPASFDGKDGHPLLTANGCREVDFRNSKDEAGSYAFPAASDSLRAVFTYGDKTCTSSGVPLSFETTAPKTCPESAGGALLADTTWQACVRASGFAQ